MKNLSVLFVVALLTGCTTTKVVYVEPVLMPQTPPPDAASSEAQKRPGCTGTWIWANARWVCRALPVVVRPAYPVYPYYYGPPQIMLWEYRRW